MRRNRIIYRLALDSMFAAMYFILTYVTIRIGNFHITFASLLTVLSSLMFGFPDALIISMLGEFLNQTLTYGIMITTPLWIIPPVLRAVVISTVSLIYRKKDRQLEKHKVAYFITVIIAGLVTSIANTGATFLDGYLIGYPVSFVWMTTLLRFLLNIVTSIVVSLAALPILSILRNAFDCPYRHNQEASHTE